MTVPTTMRVGGVSGGQARARNIIFACMVIACGAFVVATLYYLVSKNRALARELAASGARSGITVGTQLPAWPLLTLEGEATNLQSMLPAGGVVGFFTTTCPYCEENLSHWTKLAESDAPFLGISLHGAADTRDYVDSNRLSWSVSMLEGQFSTPSLGVRLVPMTVLLDSDLVVLDTWTGVLKDESLQQISRWMGVLRDRGTRSSEPERR